MPTAPRPQSSPEPVGWPGGHAAESSEVSSVSRETRGDQDEQVESASRSTGGTEQNVAPATSIAKGYDDVVLGGSASLAGEGREEYIPRHALRETDPGSGETEPPIYAAVKARREAEDYVRDPSLPSRKERRHGRPRVPSFAEMDDAEVQNRNEPQARPDAPKPWGSELPDMSANPASSGETVTDSQPRQVTYTKPEKLPRPSHPRVLTVANQKGGVGKTTTTVNVAAALAQGGLKVLVIDVDPQGNASTALGIDHHSEVDSVYDVIVDGTPLSEVIRECPNVPGLWCAPATIDLAGAEIELVSMVARESRLHRAINVELEAADADQFDYVFIDCPPSLGLLTINAFVAADEVFIPIQCEYYALEGLSQLLKNIEMIKAHLNPGLHVSTILLTMYDKRTNLSSQVADEVRAHFPNQVLGALVPRSVRISEAPSHGETVMTYDPASTGAKSYRDGARELAIRGVDAPASSARTQD